MKCIRIDKFGPPEVMRMQEAPDPEPGKGQVVVSMSAIGVNPVDAYIRSGTYPSRPVLPYTPGMDGAGVIETLGDSGGGKIGKGSNELQVGDRVYVAGTISGSYAELALCDASRVHPLPDNVSFAQGAAMGVPYGTAYRALFIRARAVPGETVLIHGASGGVGVAAVQLALSRGMRVIGTAGTEEGLQLVREQGTHLVLNHHASGYLDEVMKATGGGGVEVILEMLANVNLGNDLGVLAKSGRVVVVGSRGPVEIDPRNAMGKDASILGMSLLNADDRELFMIHSALVSGLKNGTLRPVIGKQMPLAEAARAHDAVMEPGAYGKIVLFTGSERLQAN